MCVIQRRGAGEGMAVNVRKCTGLVGSLFARVTAGKKDERGQ